MNSEPRAAQHVALMTERGARLSEMIEMAKTNVDKAFREYATDAALQGPQNAKITGCEHLPGVLEPRPIPTPPPEPATRFSPRKLNKTEARFLRDWPPGTSGLILAQALTLPFGDGTSYRPDFVLVTDGRVVAYEVKGGHVGKVAWSRHGIERFRRARERFREISFELWTWKDHQWRKL